MHLTDNGVAKAVLVEVERTPQHCGAGSGVKQLRATCAAADCGHFHGSFLLCIPFLEMLLQMLLQLHTTNSSSSKLKLTATVKALSHYPIEL